MMKSDLLVVRLVMANERKNGEIITITYTIPYCYQYRVIFYHERDLPLRFFSHTNFTITKSLRLNKVADFSFYFSLFIFLKRKAHME